MWLWSCSLCLVPQVRTLETLIRLSCAHAKVRLSAFVEKQDVEEVQALMDSILKSDPSAQEPQKRDGSRRGDRSTKRPRGADGGSSDEEEEEGVEEEGAVPMEAEAAGAGQGGAEDEERRTAVDAAVAQGAVGADTAAAIHSAINELSQANGGQGSATGVRAVLAGKGVHVSSDEVMTVLNQLNDDEKIMLDGEEFWMAT